MKLLYAAGRQRVATEEEYQALLRHCSDDHFRHVRMALRFTVPRATARSRRFATSASSGPLCCKALPSPVRRR